LGDIAEADGRRKTANGNAKNDDASYLIFTETNPHGSYSLMWMTLRELLKVDRLDKAFTCLGELPATTSIALPFLCLLSVP
jgi:hypothetical protein